MDIKHTVYNLELNKSIHVFDNILPLSVRNNIFTIAQNSKFELGWSDTNIPENKSQDCFIHSVWDTDKIINETKLFHFITTPLLSLLDGLSVSRVVLNLTVPVDVNHIHTHKESKVLLYYVNLDWNEAFHGETQFWSEDLKRIQFSSPYVPGRLILFDADIPHTIRPQSIIGPKFRFTLSILLNK